MRQVRTPEPGQVIALRRWDKIVFLAGLNRFDGFAKVTCPMSNFDRDRLLWLVGQLVATHCLVPLLRPFRKHFAVIAAASLAAQTRKHLLVYRVIDSGAVADDLSRADRSNKQRNNRTGQDQHPNQGADTTHPANLPPPTPPNTRCWNTWLPTLWCWTRATLTADARCGRTTRRCSKCRPPQVLALLLPPTGPRLTPRQRARPTPPTRMPPRLQTKTQRTRSLTRARQSGGAGCARLRLATRGSSQTQTRNLIFPRSLARAPPPVPRPALL